MEPGGKQPSEVIEGFLSWINEEEKEYAAAREGVHEEDQLLQDLLHDLEFASGAKERREAGNALHASRNRRRAHKDRVQELERIHGFFADGANRKTLQNLKQLLGAQRKTEEYLTGERAYKYRIKDTKKAEG